MSEKTVLVSKENWIATITLNRPDKMNAWNEEMSAQIDEAVSDAGHDPEVRVVILTGAGKGFCTGADVSYLSGLGERSNPPLTTMSLTLMGKANPTSAVIKIRSMLKPVIAAVNGIAAGGGLSLALGCDIRIASEDARFNAVFVKRGIIPDVGGTYTLPHLLGLSRACELVFAGDIISAREAERIGMVNRVVPAQELMTAARDLATRIAQNPPLAVGMAKAALYKGALETDISTQMDLEGYTQNLLFRTDDFKEGVQSFMEKRAPVFKGS